MDNIAELSKQFTAASDGMDAILKVAEADDERQLTEDERTRFDELETQADGLKAQIDQINADRGRSQRQTDRRAALAQPMNRQTTPADIDQAGVLDADGITKKDRDRIRREYRRAGKLRGFEGPTAEHDAYLCGQWLRATLFGDRDALKWCREHGGEQLAMAGDSNIKGGALVPDEFDAAVIKLQEEYGVARRICKITPMASDTKIVPRYVSGLTAYAIGENEEITASDEGWDNIQLVARKWGVLAKYSSELDEDAVISFAAELADEIAYAFASAEDGALVLGDGTSTYHGIVGLKNAIAAGSVYTAIAGNIAFSSLDLADFEAIVGQLPEYPGINPSWLISKAGYAASMMRLIDAAGGNTSAQIEGGPGGREFLGYPVVISQKCNSTLTDQVNATGVLFFGDFKMGTLLGDRRQTRVKMSSERYFEYDQLGILGTFRYDIKVHGAGTASAAGPIISLTIPAA